MYKKEISLNSFIGSFDFIGEGTFGKIYLVEDPDDFKKYALKKISVSDMEELSDNKREFELLMKISQENPTLNVVKIFGIQINKLDKFNLINDSPNNG